MTSPTLDLKGQGPDVIGQPVVSPWLGGASYPVDQGWGATQVSLAPAGHGYAHWHTGVDIGCPCGTVIHLPNGLAAVAKLIDNPGGYGTALVLQTAGGDVWLGHLASRLVNDGQQLRGGEAVAISNNTGNSTGCHLHFELRPKGGGFGSDVDPSMMLLDPTGDGSTPPEDGTTTTTTLSYIPGVSELEAGFAASVQQAIAMGEVGLGSVIMLAGLGVVTYGLRGQNLQHLQRDAGRQWGSAARGVERARRGSAADAQEAAAEARATSPAALDRETMARYRLGLISRRVAQERLGEPVRGTGRRPSEVAFGEGATGPGVYRRRGGGTVQMESAHLSRIRPSLQRKLARPVSPSGV